MSLNYFADLPEDIQEEMELEVRARIEKMMDNAFLRPYIRQTELEYFKMMFEKQYLRAKLVEIYDQLSDSNAENLVLQRRS